MSERDYHWASRNRYTIAVVGIVGPFLMGIRTSRKKALNILEWF
jgi:hypothetical protein